MLNKKLITWMWILLFLCPTFCFAQEEDGIGQMIQIYARFHSFVGRPSWLLEIRDLDHSENLPYLFEITRGDHYWVAPTVGQNYLILASTMKLNTYRPRDNTYKIYQIKNFCNLESNGRISRGESFYITISGNLSPDSNTYTCHIAKYNRPL